MASFRGRSGVLGCPTRSGARFDTTPCACARARALVQRRRWTWTGRTTPPLRPVQPTCPSTSASSTRRSRSSASRATLTRSTPSSGTPPVGWWGMLGLSCPGHEQGGQLALCCHCPAPVCRPQTPNPKPCTCLSPPLVLEPNRLDAGKAWALVVRGSSLARRVAPGLMLGRPDSKGVEPEARQAGARLFRAQQGDLHHQVEPHR
jgi:hypothetical protein